MTVVKLGNLRDANFVDHRSNFNIYRNIALCGAYRSKFMFMESEKNPNSLFPNVGRHILLIAAFYLVPYLFGAQDIIRLPDLSRPGQLVEFLGYTMMLVFLYANYYLLVPQLFLKKQYLRYSFITILCVAFILVFPYLSNSGIDRPPPDFRQGINQPKDWSGIDAQQDHQKAARFERPRLQRPPISILLKHNLTFFAMCFLATMFWHSRRRSNQLENEKKNAEMAYLRTQMNPHFMFNSLNSAYGLAIGEGADKTSDSLLKLSDMMRYLLVRANKDRVELSVELKYIDDYVNFQRLRLPGTVQLNCTIQHPDKHYEIAPMLLLPFVENAFKHGVSADKKCSIEVKIYFVDDKLMLDVQNDWVDAIPADREQSGFGMSSTRKRLELIYPSRHRLEILDNSKHFRVQLSIQLI